MIRRASARLRTHDSFRHSSRKLRWKLSMLSSDEVRHDIRGEKFTGLYVVPLIAIDQQLDAGVLVLPDQVDGLGHRTDKAAQRSAGSQPLALRRHRGRVAGKQPVLNMGVFSIVS